MTYFPLARHRIACFHAEMNTQAAQTPPPDEVRTRIQKLARECVMCGICVPHCPTFALTQNEADGPRGRISLALGLADGRLAPDASVVAHLDRCLSCRACEAVCPSLVHYGALIDEVRDALAQDVFSPATPAGSSHPQAATRRWAWRRDHILSKRRLFGRLWRALVVLDALHFTPLIRRFGGRMAAILPPKLARPFRPERLSGQRAVPHTEPKTVGLFIGCTGESLNSDAVRASIKVLNGLGYAVDVPAAQVCCGAMHQHGGELSTAARLRAENRAAFSDKRLTALIVIGTACTGELQREPNDWPRDVPVMEITDFLAQIPDDQWPPLQPNAARVAIHLPCSQSRVLKKPLSTEQLLKKIPQLTLIPLATNDRCCGAAGMHVLMYLEQADALRAPKLDEIAKINPNVVVSTNIGCATHLAVGLGAAVLHPVELLAQSFAHAQ